MSLISLNGHALFVDTELASSPGTYTAIDVPIPLGVRDVIAQFTLSDTSTPVGSIAATVATVEGWDFVDFGQPTLALATIDAATPKSLLMQIRDVPGQWLRFVVTVSSGTAVLNGVACGRS